MLSWPSGDSRAISLGFTSAPARRRWAKAASTQSVQGKGGQRRSVPVHDANLVRQLEAHLKQHTIPLKPSARVGGIVMVNGRISFAGVRASLYNPRSHSLGPPG